MAAPRKLSKYGRLHPGDVNVPHRKLVLFAADTPNSWKPAAVLEELKVRTFPQLAAHVHAPPSLVSPRCTVSPPLRFPRRRNVAVGTARHTTGAGGDADAWTGFACTNDAPMRSPWTVLLSDSRSGGRSSRRNIFLARLQPQRLWIMRCGTRMYEGNRCLICILLLSGFTTGPWGWVGNAQRPPRRLVGCLASRVRIDLVRRNTDEVL
jgi:hypothetical protein